MSEMILDSLFLVAITIINKNGKPPRNVYISRHGFKQRYHICAVLDAACKLTKMKRPSDNCSAAHALTILQRGISVIHRKRRRSSFRFYPHSTNKVIGGDMSKMVDLRSASCNVGGLALNRLLSIINETNRTPSPQEGQAALELLRRTELVIVDNELQSARLQSYLAKQALVTLCVTNEQASDLSVPEVTGWGTPHVDHQ